MGTNSICDAKHGQNLCSLVVFSLDRQYALHIGIVERVVRAAEIIPLSNAPEIVLGIIDVHGSVLPVVNMRRRFRLPQREIEPENRLIIAHSARRRVALLVDSVAAVVVRDKEDLVPAEAIVPGLEYVEGVTKLDDNLVVIHDLETFLSLEEERALNEALKSAQ